MTSNLYKGAPFIVLTIHDIANADISAPLSRRTSAYSIHTTFGDWLVKEITQTTNVLIINISLN